MAKWPPLEGTRTIGDELMNVEGYIHEPLDFHALTKAHFNLQVSEIKGLDIGFRKRLVGGPIFEKMRLASWNI